MSSPAGPELAGCSFLVFAFLLRPATLAQCFHQVKPYGRISRPEYWLRPLMVGYVGSIARRWLLRRKLVY